MLVGTLAPFVAVSFALLLATLATLGRDGAGREGGVVLHDTLSGLLWAFLLLTSGVTLVAAKYQDPAVAVEGDASWWFVGACLVGCTLAACLVLLYVLRRRVCADEEGITLVGMFGGRRRVPWSSVETVSTSVLGKSVKISTRDGDSVSVNGGNASYRAFLEYAARHLERKQGKELLRQVEENIVTGRRR